MSCLARTVQVLLTIVTPVVLVLTGVRLVMTPWFLDLEYSRADFPPDSFGFTQAQRRQYAVYPLAYLVNDEPIDYLAGMTLPGGAPMFNARELGHLQDVQRVTQAAFRLHLALLAITGAALLILALLPKWRWCLFRAAYGGGLLTLALLVALVVVGALNWNFFFATFHSFFFEGGTWQFAYSDTLIRLFPDKFWLDAAVTVGALTAIGALGLIVIGGEPWRRPGRRQAG